MFHSFRRRLRDRNLLLGALVSLPSPEVAEIMASAGFDWLFLDSEHGAFGPLEAQRLIQAVGDRCPCLVRVPAADEIAIKKALDIGAAGIIVPQVNTAAAAECIVQLCKYPPEGVRGVGIARAHGYGGYFSQYVQSANADVSIVVQVEHIEAVRNIEHIVRVKGVDAVFVGPFDLAASMGCMGQVSAPEVSAAISTVRESCQRAGMPLGYFGLDAPAVLDQINQGFTLIAAGCDAVWLANSARSTLQALNVGKP